MKELLYKFDNRQTVKTGKNRYRYIQVISPSYKIFREGDVLIHETKEGKMSYEVPPNYEGKVIDGCWTDLFKNVNSKFFTYELESDLVFKFPDNTSFVDKLVDVENHLVPGKMISRIVKAEEILNWSKGGRIAKTLRNIKGFDSGGRPVPVISIARLGNKVIIEFKKEVAIVDPQWTSQPDSSTGKDVLVSESYPDTNYGNHDFLLIGYIYYEPGIEGIFLSYIEFVDFEENIPEGAEISTAWIYLWHKDGLIGTQSIYSKRVQESWTEAMTWNTRANFGVPQGATVNGSNDPQQADVKDTVIGICNDTLEDFGFAFRGTNETAGQTNYVSDRSCENATAGERPKLEINYSVGGKKLINGFDSPLLKGVTM